MNIEQKERLAMTGDYSDIASGRRVRAARLVAGISQEALGQEAGISKSAVGNIEKGRSFAQRPIMVYFFRNHRIDFNFFIAGLFNQLPADVQIALFEKLEVVASE